MPDTQSLSTPLGRRHVLLSFDLPFSALSMFSVNIIGTKSLINAACGNRAMAHWHRVNHVDSMVPYQERRANVKRKTNRLHRTLRAIKDLRECDGFPSKSPPCPLRDAIEVG